MISSTYARAFLLPLLVVCSLFFPGQASAKYDFLQIEETVAANSVSKEPLTVEFVSFTDSIEQGEAFWVGIRLDVKEGWKTYWKNPGESGYPLTIDWDLPPGFTVEEVLWPTPKKSVVQDLVVYGYDEPVTLLARIVPSASLKNTDSIKATLRWLVCNDQTCLPGEGEIQLSLNGSQDELHLAMEKMPRELADAELHEVSDQGVVLFVPKNAFGAAPGQVEFYPDEALSLKKDLKFTHDPNQGAFIHLQPFDGTALKGVLEFVGVNGSESFAIDLPLKQTLNADLTINPYAEEVSSFGMILLFAFIGGMILNLMPCVLPVVSLKVLSFINMAGQSRRKTMMHGMMFSMGVLVSFWVLAAIILVLREFGHSVGWGFQLQNETFVGILAALLLILSLWLFGVFELGFGLSAKTGDVVEKAKKKEGGKLFGSFLSGVLATAVATPCSGPFLGTALGVAVTVPALQSLLIFTLLGLGMASPYLVLSAYPSLLRFMPKPGAWMETFKQLMGFMMLFVVIWLIWVFVSQSDSANILPLLVGFLLLSFGAWAYGKSTMGFKKTITKATLMGIALISTVAGFYSIVDAGKQSVLANTGSSRSEMMVAGWEKFSNAQIDKLREEGKGVFIDFTAKWCLLCQANLIILKMPTVEKTMEEAGVVKMMADWTKSDPEITEHLAKFGRNSVPLYVYYPPGKNSKPQVLPQVLTQDVLLEIFAKE